MTIIPIISKNFSSNCFLIKSDKVILIDSGMGDEILNEILINLNNNQSSTIDMPIDMLINTHCHYDHIGNNQRIKKKFNTDVAMHEKDIYALKNIKGASYASLFDSEVGDFDFERILKGWEVINLKDHCIEVIHTPGHTEGSICLYDKKTKSLFSGDTIFEKGFGRTDLLGGDYNKLKKSINCLDKINKESGIKKVYPGHGRIFDFYSLLPGLL